MCHIVQIRGAQSAAREWTQEFKLFWDEFVVTTTVFFGRHPNFQHERHEFLAKTFF